MRDNHQIKAISFDFDGVFVRDSDAIFKQEGWQLVFSKYRTRHESALARALDMFGSGKRGGRSDILRFVFQEIGVAPDLIGDAVRSGEIVFNSHVQSRIMEAGLVSGSIDTLESITNRGIKCYINSGTETAPLIESIRLLKIEEYFADILGSLMSKSDNLRHILAVEKILPQNLLVVGDGHSDASAAESIGSTFVGIANRWNGWITDQPFPIIFNICDVMKYC